MTGRVSAFADAEIIKMATEDFIPVTGDDWYQRRRQDAEGDFFRMMSDQTPRKASGKTSTRQGIYVFTADGEALSFKNAGQDADVTRTELKRALAKFDRLPAARRTPGAVRVPKPGRPDPNYTRPRPAGSTTVKVNARLLDRAEDGFKVGTCDTPGGLASARDFMWILAHETAALAPADPTVGMTFPLPPTLTTRICRYHLTDFTRGEPDAWQPGDVRRADLMVTVTAVTPEMIELRVDGTALLANDADPEKASHGFDVRLTGRLSFNRTDKDWERFDLAAIGDHWGTTGHQTEARPGRSPLGITFGPVVLPTGPAADQVPPQSARDLAEYLGKR